MNVAQVLNHYGYGLSTSYLNGNINLVCPFHSDTQASLSVNLKEGFLYCFGCGWKGGIVEFVAKYEDVNQLQAMQKVSKILNGNINSKPIIAEEMLPKHLDFESIRKAYSEWKGADVPDWDMPNYLSGRGLSSKTLKEFKVRCDFLNYYPYVIPICENGKFKGYVRTGESREPKYLYSKGFKRSLVLMGDFKVGVIFVTEGVLDYLKAHQFGYRNAVSLLGWKASSEQVKKLSKASSVIIGALDNDEKGREGMQYLRKHFKVIDFPYPDDVKDIGEMNQEQFHKSIELIKQRRS